MKILILSDIHGNRAALEAVCEKADMIFCLGDIVNYGPYPNECIKMVRNLTDKIVRGNHDNAIGRGMDCGCSSKYKELSDAGKAFTNSVLYKNEKDFLGNLPITLRLEVEGKKFLFAHSSPNGNLYKYLKPDSTDKELENEVKDAHADIVFVGHTHLPMIRTVLGITMVNPGSVGQPRDGNPMASYAVWEDGNIDIRRIPYDIDATVKGLQTTDIADNHIAQLSMILRNGGM
ncbi:MAG: YfcE family phosphodiesterase [Candidatus Brocadiaceae bacterium]|nr:YfcE family phosphodiesterase [Candidatus Brocadiaceae bacterium]